MANLQPIGSVQGTPPQGLCLSPVHGCGAWTSHGMAEQLLCPPPAHAVQDHAEDKSQEEK